MFNIDRRVMTHFDYLSVFITIPIILMSIFLIYEINPSASVRQLAYIGVTFIISVVIFFFPIKKFFWLVSVFYWLLIAILISTLFFGVTKFGAQRWLEIPFLGISMQPSETMKIALILMLAYNINKNPPPPEGYHLKDFLKLSFFIALPAVLVKMQPDLGTAILIFALGFGILLIVGIYKKIIYFMLGIAAICALLMLFTPLIDKYLHGYQVNRIDQFLNTNPQYQVKQSMIAIGSAGVFGKNMSDSTQSQLRFLPVPESDFIFPYFVERFGFFGALALISAFGLLILHLVSLSYANRNEQVAQVLCAGLAILIFVHFSVNVAMTLKLAPVVGIPIPFFSYGGSSFLTFGALFALMQNLLAFKYHFKV